jgi:hypothetical protein
MARQKKKTKKQEFLDQVTAEGFEAYNYVAENIVWNEPYRFPDTERSFRPQCINHGCCNPVTIFRGILSEPKGRVLRTVCTPCHLASYGKKSLLKGVTAHKKDYCENRDGHLGFSCTSTIHGTWVLELDHMDGNHLHNVPANVETLCKICHAQKSRLAGDYKKSSTMDTSPHNLQQNISLPVDDSIPHPKNDPNLQTSNLCNLEIGQQGTLALEDIQPISLSG